MSVKTPRRNGMSVGPQDDTILDGTWVPPDPEEQALARKAVARYAKDDTERARFLDLLGLTEVDQTLGS